MYRPWLYFVLNKPGQSGTLENGVVSYKSDPTPLIYTPSGWQDILIGWERDLDKYGLTTTSSFQLGFVEDGAKILRDAVYNKNIEEELYLLIKRFGLKVIDGKFYPKYDYFYKAPIDLSTFADEETKVTVKLTDKSIAALIKSKGGTTYEVTPTLPVKMDGIYLQEKHNWVITGSDSTAVVAQFLLGAAFTTKEGDAAGFASFTTFGDALFTNSEVNTSSEYIFATTQTITGLRISGSVKVKHPILFSLWLKTNKGQNIQLSEIVTEDGTVTVSFDHTFNASEGENFFLVGINDLAATYILDGSFSVEYQSKYKTTYIKGMPLADLFQQLAPKMAGADALAVSSILEANRNLFVTSGDAVRGIANAKIKTSFNSFTDACKVILGAGVGAEGKRIVIEKQEYFFDASNPIPLGQVKNFKKSVATDLLCNSIKIGYNTISTDDVNGKYAFNNTHQYASPITRITKELNLVSPYYTDPYAIELKRINLEGKTTTDDSNDNDIFIINVKEEVKQASGTAEFSHFDLGPLKVNVIEFTGDATNMEAFQQGSKITIAGSGANQGTFTLASTAQSTPTGFSFMVNETVAPETVAVTFTTTTYSLNRPTMDITGVPSPETVFNIPQLTPKRLMQTHAKDINSRFHGFAGKKLTFQTTEKNAELVADGIIEKADVTIGTDKLYLPFYFEFDTEVPIDLATLLEENPNRCFSFEDENGQTFTGFLVKAGLAPNDLKEQAYKLLSTASNDLSKLI